MDSDSDITVEKIEAVALPEQAALMSDLSKAPMPTHASDYTPLIQFFGIRDVNRETQDKLQTVWEHFATDVANPGTALKRLKQQIYNMPQPNIGDNRLNQLYNYVKVIRQYQDAKDMKEAFEL
jgi:hypothetical protein